MTATTVTGALPRVEWFVGVPGVRKSLRGRQVSVAVREQRTLGSGSTLLVPAAPRSSFDLVQDALDAYNDLRRTQALPRSFHQLRTFVHVAYACAVDNGPAMQVRAHPDGAVEAYWVAGGHCAALSVYGDGSFSLWGEEEGVGRFDIDHNKGEQIGEGEQVVLREFFGEAASAVRFDV